MSDNQEKLQTFQRSRKIRNQMKNHLSEIDTEDRLGNDIKIVIVAVFQMFKKLKEYMNMLRVTEDIKNAQIQLLESKTTV